MVNSFKDTGYDIIRQWRESPIKFVREQLKAEPDPWQKEFLEILPHENRISLNACKGPGKLEPVDTVIVTPNGKRVWGNLEEGDLVFAEDGTPTEIIGTYPQGKQDIYRVMFDDGSYCDCGLEHLWKVRGRTEKRHKTWVVKETKDLIPTLEVSQGKSSYYQYQIPKQGAVQFPFKTLCFDSYLLGVWLGDGSASAGVYTKPDIDIEKEINSRGYKTKRHKNQKTVTVYRLTSKLKEIGIWGKKSDTKFIPEDYKYGSIVQRKDLLAGLMDTDGTIDKDDGSTEYDTTSKQLADDVVWLVRSLGGKAWIQEGIKKGWYPKDGKRVYCKDCYKVRISVGFNPFKLTRKAIKWHVPTQDRYLMRTIKSIEKIGNKEAMCIEVEHESHCYLTNDFIVTHNTTALAWAIWWFLTVYPNPNIAATSITSDNLSDGLWKELAKWQNKSDFLKASFVWSKTRIVAKDHAATWWCSARTWNKNADSTQQADTLAGLHADYLMFVLDEAGGMPDAVMAAAEAGLATGIITKIIIAGNPTHTQGPLYRASTNERHMWYVIEITGDPDDPNRSPRISKKWAYEQIEKYGRDNPWVLVNVFGKFPPSSLNTLIGPDDVRTAMKRHYTDDVYKWSQKRLGIDVARFGDDKTVLFPRQGKVAFRPVTMRHKRDSAVSVDISTRTQMAKVRWGSELELFDDTVGWAHGAIDHMRSCGHTPIPIDFGGKALDGKYENKRAEMWFEMCDWILAGGALPDVPELVAELSTPTYFFSKHGKFQLESKDQIKERLSRSPDYADGLALTFALPDMPGNESRVLQSVSKATGGGTIQVAHEYDPYDEKRL